MKIKLNLKKSADSADEYTIKILTWNGNISSLAPISNTLDLSIK
jgi:hypothetical protein